MRWRRGRAARRLCVGWAGIGRAHRRASTVERLPRRRARGARPCVCCLPRAGGGVGVRTAGHGRAFAPILRGGWPRLRSWPAPRLLPPGDCLSSPAWSLRCGPAPVAARGCGGLPWCLCPPAPVDAAGLRRACAAAAHHRGGGGVRRRPPRSAASVSSRVPNPPAQGQDRHSSPGFKHPLLLFLCTSGHRRVPSPRRGLPRARSTRSRWRRGARPAAADFLCSSVVPPRRGGRRAGCPS